MEGDKEERMVLKAGKVQRAAGIERKLLFLIANDELLQTNTQPSLSALSPSLSPSALIDTWGLW